MSRSTTLAAIAMRNIRSYRFRTFVIVSIIALGTFVLVCGLSIVRTMDEGMEAATTGSLTGDLQVWSKQGPDRLRLVNVGSDEPDIGEIDDFQRVREQLLAVDGVQRVVPMAFGTAFSQREGRIDRSIEELRAAVAAGDTALQATLRAELQDAARVLDAGFAEQGLGPDDASRRIAQEVAGEAFWASVAEEPDGVLQRLDADFAPIGPVSQPFIFEFLASNPSEFVEAFPRVKLVEGEMVPPGKRGILVAHRYWERQLKHSVARELDWFAGNAEAGRNIDRGALMQSHKATLAARGAQLALDIRRAELAEVTQKLQKFLGMPDANIVALLEAFLKIDNANIAERHAFFHAEIAPTIPLHFLNPGDEIVLRGFTQNGYLRSVQVRFYGTFVFEGLEEAQLTNTKNLLDLVTFRELYGQMSDAQLEELNAIRDAVGVEVVKADDMEDAFFGEDAEIVVAGDSDGAPDEPETFVANKGLEDRLYTAQEMDGGLVRNIAVFVNQGVDPAVVQARIAAIDGLQVTDWREAAGLVGQFVTAMTGILWGAVALIFLIALVVLNNTILVSTMERVVEIGTLRALGANRRDVVQLVLLEAVVTSLVGGAVGVVASVGILSWLGAVGIPAPTPTLTLLFGGTSLHPKIFVADVFTAFGLVMLISLLSTLHPARVATKIPPVVAMRGRA